MRTFHRVHERTKLTPIKAEERLSIGHSAAVISGLSVLAWGVVILLAMALRVIV